MNVLPSIENAQLLERADRIQARAIRRCGELLKQIEPARGHENGTVPTRSGEAEKAGLSERQRKTALRVASVPEDDFERQVESDSPPTITALQAEANREALGFGERTAQMLLKQSNTKLASDLEPREALAFDRKIWGNHNHRAEGMPHAKQSKSALASARDRVSAK